MVGTTATSLTGVNIVALKKGKQLTRDQGDKLTELITEAEIYKALKGIRDDSSLGINGYGSKFYKVTWEIIKTDLMKAVLDLRRKNSTRKSIALL